MFDSTVINSINPNNFVAHIYNLNYYPDHCWHYVINRNFIIAKRLYFVNVKIAEDQEYVARLLCLMKKFFMYEGRFYYHRLSSARLSNSVDYDACVSFLYIVIEMAKFISNNYLSNIKKEFIYSRIKYALGSFSAILHMRNRAEIYKLSNVIENNIDNLLILPSYVIDMFLFVKTYGAYKGLLLYKRFTYEETISLINNNNYKEIYIFCVGLFAEVTAQILQNEGYCVKGFLDNNKTLDGSFLSGLKVSIPSALSYRSKEGLKDVFVVVCNQKTTTFEEISSQLEGLGLKKVQIAQKIF